MSEPTSTPPSDVTATDMPPEHPHHYSPVARVARILLQIVVGAVIVWVGLQVRAYFMAEDEGGPGARFGGPPGTRNATLVEVIEVDRGDEHVSVHASGEVVAAVSISLQARVQGEVVELHPSFEPGGVVDQGVVLVRLDDDEYQLAVRQARANRDSAQAGRRIESGNQAIARNEYELYGGGDIDEESRDLVLRQPQVDAAEASYEAADAQLDLARLNLRRTRIEAPFDASIESRNVNIGSRVAPGAELARLVGTDTFWVEAAIPLDELDWIQVAGDSGQPGSPVRVSQPSVWGPDRWREGHVVRLLPSLEQGGRLARLLVAIDDPLCRRPENAGKPQLFLGGWVELSIQGTLLRDVVALDRDLVRDGRDVWVLDAEERLAVRPLEFAFRGRDEVLVSSGLEAGDRVVTTTIAAPVAGMQLRTRDSAPPPGEGSGDGAGRRAGPAAERGGQGSAGGPPAGARRGPP